MLLILYLFLAQGLLVVEVVANNRVGEIRAASRAKRLADDEIYGMRDVPIAGDDIYYLDNRPCKLRKQLLNHSNGRRDGDDCPRWVAQSTNDDDYGPLEIPATVPGDLISDLVEANLLEEPYFETNFQRNTSLWSGRVWNYTTTFSLDDASFDADAEEILLIFDGIKMGANVFVNGVQLGTATDQFLRYSFPLVASGILDSDFNLRKRHTVTVSFDPEITTDGRFMACSGGSVSYTHLTLPTILRV